MSKYASGMLRLVLCAALFIGFAAVSSAQNLVLAPAGDLPRVTAEASQNCVAGLTNDDGTFESSLKVTDDGAAVEATVVMRFQAAADRDIEQVCVCWRRDAGAAATLDHDLLLFAADGSGGTPGTLLETLDAEVDLPVGQSFVTYDLSGLDWETPGSSFYVGARWNGGAAGSAGYSLCSDLSGPGISPTFFQRAGEEEWTNVNSEAEFSVSALGIRVELVREGTQQECEIGACVPGPNSLCLNEDRFRISAFFDNPNSPEPLFAPAEGEEVRDDSGLFTFFDEENIELVVKALDACDSFDRFWFFAGGLTNVETVINVCDTETGEDNQYVNPQGVPFQPILDTEAFATCP